MIRAFLCAIGWIFAIFLLTVWDVAPLPAQIYWSVFNPEGASATDVDYATYATLGDMLGDTNRTGLFRQTDFNSRAFVGSGSDGTTYWNVFNIEGDTSLLGAYETYATLGDMLAHTNPTGHFNPSAGGLGRHIVGSGSDGTSYWSVFNPEGASATDVDYATYATLGDMLGDTNRTGLFRQTDFNSRAFVGSGSDGTTYWNVFNIEGDTSLLGAYETYATLGDMLAHTNPTGHFNPSAGGLGRHIVGSGATVVPEPTSFAMFGLALVGMSRRRRQR